MKKVIIIFFIAVFALLAIFFGVRQITGNVVISDSEALLEIPEDMAAEEATIETLELEEGQIAEEINEGSGQEMDTPPMPQGCFTRSIIEKVTVIGGSPPMMDVSVFTKKTAAETMALDSCKENILPAQSEIRLFEGNAEFNCINQGCQFRSVILSDRKACKVEECYQITKVTPVIPGDDPVSLVEYCVYDSKGNMVKCDFVLSWSKTADDVKKWRCRAVGPTLSLRYDCPPDLRIPSEADPTQWQRYLNDP